MKEFVDSQHVR